MKQKRSKTPLQSILGMAPWNVWKGYGSFLFFDFGRKRRIDKDTVAGQFVLEISMAHWVIQQGRKEVAHSESPDNKIIRSAKQFEGKRLLEITLRKHHCPKRTLYSARFTFEDHWHLDVYMYETGKHDDMFAVLSASTLTTYDYTGELNTRRRPKQSSRRTVDPRRVNVR